MYYNDFDLFRSHDNLTERINLCVIKTNGTITQLIYNIRSSIFKQPILLFCWSGIELYITSTISL